VAVRGSRLVFAPPKYDKQRTLPLPSSVREAVAAHLAAQPAERQTLPWRTPDGAPVTAVLICSTREHRPINRNYFTTVWHKALRSIGVQPGQQNGTHALRHFYASVLLDAGESIKVVSEHLGHADPGFTLRTYTHLMPDTLARSTRAIDAVFAPESAMGVPSAEDA
jgi:integrase